MGQYLFFYPLTFLLSNRGAAFTVGAACPHFNGLTQQLKKEYEHY